MKSFDPVAIEEKWRKVWEKSNRWQVSMRNPKKPYYNLMMFPYPSAEGLHIGNVFAFTASDIHGRFRRLQGYDVFEPMGFDAFGIHSENFAIKKNVHPKKLVAESVRHFRDDQLKKMGALFDWTHELNTTDPAYYKWTQWLFLQLFKKGLAYRAKASVDFCPHCKTVLADEQVIGGKCERCDTVVVQKELLQWFLKITDYAEKLLKNLEDIDWSSDVKTIQKNWIGKSEGTLIRFKIEDLRLKNKEIEVFTTRPDTLFGATYVVLAPEHPLIEKLKAQISNVKEVDGYIESAKRKSELERTELQKEKTGVELKGVKAINPATKKEIPIFIADYVLKGYGTGAIMAVPVHDKRDFAFAKKFGLPMVRVIAQDKTDTESQDMAEAYEGEGFLVNSGKFNGVSSGDAKKEITKAVDGETTVKYHLRDWLISRQRYWGPPIPIIYCDKCGIVPVPEKDLPVLLPDVADFHPTGTDKSPLASVKEFVETTCPTCGGAAQRETDVSDTFLDSSWYFLRYPSVGLGNSKFEILNPKQTQDSKSKTTTLPWNAEITKKWLPVDMYIGGREHAVLHLLYARFITMALKDMGLIQFAEPFKKFRAHGLLVLGGAKMSKSKGNVVNPDEYFASYGVDITRTYLMFLGPISEGGDWSDKGIRGIARFLKRVFLLLDKADAKANSLDDLERVRHKTIAKVTEDMESLRYNTAISAMMEYLNAMSNVKGQIPKSDIETLLVLLAPFAPHLAEEFWQILGNAGSVHETTWPAFDPKLLREKFIAIPVQINGKTRAVIEVQAGISKEKLEKLALADANIEKRLGGATIEKVIFVQDRMINFVTIT